MKTNMNTELQLSANEKKAFEAGFHAGFSISFDGWHGQIFREFNRPFHESEEFNKNLSIFLTNYEEQVHEQSRLLPFEVLSEGSPEKPYSICTVDNSWIAVVRDRESRQQAALNGAPTGSLPSPLYPRTIQRPTFFSDNPDHYQQPATTDSEPSTGEV